MTSLERVSSFIKSYIPDDEGDLGAIYREAVAARVPVMRPETRELLKTQLLLKKPVNVLEIGTAVGYSALYMRQHLAPDAHITTMELDDERIAKAIENIERVAGAKPDMTLKATSESTSEGTSARSASGITLLCGDAYELIKTLPADTYDFVFMDAAKAQYLNYLSELYRVVVPGALIFTDNVLQEGEILESHFTVNKRNRTIHDRMREFLKVITTDERLATSVLSVADGVALSVVVKKDK